MARYVMTARRKAALRKAQMASARKRKGRGRGRKAARIAGGVALAAVAASGWSGKTAKRRTGEAWKRRKKSHRAFRKYQRTARKLNRR